MCCHVVARYRKSAALGFCIWEYEAFRLSDQPLSFSVISAAARCPLAIAPCTVPVFPGDIGRFSGEEQGILHRPAENVGRMSALRLWHNCRLRANMDRSASHENRHLPASLRAFSRLTFSSPLSVCKLRATTDTFSDINRSAHRKGAHPVINGSRSGMVVHHVGNHSSWENKKLISSQGLVRSPRAGLAPRSALGNGEQCVRLFPSPARASAFNFSSGSAGRNSIAPRLASAASAVRQEAPSTIARLARNETGLP